jgi:hypothetical protein
MIKYLNLSQILENYPFTFGQMRNFLMNKHKNGLNNCTRKIGRRLYFREDLFDEWIESKKTLDDE